MPKTGPNKDGGRKRRSNYTMLANRMAWFVSKSSGELSKPVPLAEVKPSRPVVNRRSTIASRKKTHRITRQEKQHCA
jgi:hypothetical protein